MHSSASGSSDPLEIYDELVMAGEAPDPAEFCRDYPEHPELPERIRALDALRAELDDIAREVGRPAPEWPSEIGGFRLKTRLGQGGMGVVFIGEHVDTQTECAVKLLASRSAIALERFRREARVIKGLSHPGIPTAFGFGVVSGQAFLATELLSGTSLGEVIGRADRLPSRAELPGIVEIAWKVADALAHAHAHGILHRDVKPANIMLTDEGEPKLIDFGLAFEPGPERLTATGTFLGSAAYAAPEQLRGEQAQIGPWTDTYSLGVTLFELLAHTTPFGDSKSSSAREKLRATPRDYNPEVPRSLDKIVKKALSPAPKKRYRDGAELARALEKWLG